MGTRMFDGPGEQFNLAPPDGWLPRGLLRCLRRVVIAAGLDRHALLGGLAPTFAQSLHTSSNPAAQVCMDLDELNRTPTLEDGILPLRIWLENAVDLLGPRSEAMVVTSALTWLDVETDEQIAEAARPVHHVWP